MQSSAHCINTDYVVHYLGLLLEKLQCLPPLVKHFINYNCNRGLLRTSTLPAQDWKGSQKKKKKKKKSLVEFYSFLCDSRQ